MRSVNISGTRGRQGKNRWMGLGGGLGQVESEKRGGREPGD